MGSPPPPASVTGWLVGGTFHAMLSAITSWVDGAAGAALRVIASLLGASTSPALLSTWFSATYWRLSALSALLTVPFLFAAAVHALVRSDLALLGRAAFGYLPLAMLGVTVAAPLTTLALAATDEMCAVVASAAGQDDGALLGHLALGVTTISATGLDPGLAFFVGLLLVTAAIGLWVELLVRAAAVEVIVLMLPLFFAAMVWPARRLWAIRAIETLVALILSKFAIVAVLCLGGAALTSGSHSASAVLQGLTLIVLAGLAPWALLRILPLHEVAAAAAGGLSSAPHAVLSGATGRLSGALGGSGDGEAGGGSPSDGLDVQSGTAVPAPALLDFAGARTAGGAQGPPGAGGWAPPGGGRATGAAGRGAGDLAGNGGFDEDTQAGLMAVGRAGDRPSHPVAAVPPVTFAAPDDGRPPINEPFRPGRRWEGFILGEEGDEVMAPPRFAEDATALEPDPVGAEGQLDSGAPNLTSEDRPSAIEPPESSAGLERP